MKRLLVCSFIVLSFIGVMIFARGGGHGGGHGGHRGGHGGRGGYGHGGRGWGHGGWGRGYGYGGWGPGIGFGINLGGPSYYPAPAYNGCPDYAWCVRNRTTRCLECYPDLR